MFSHYLALGDSLSLDLYPALDAGRTDVAVALERIPTAGHVAPLGAASLLHRNDDEQWPDETGRDLATRCPGVALTILATDGATIGDVFGDQLPHVGANDEPTLVTITVGSEDLFSAYRNQPSPKLLRRIASDVSMAYEALIARVLELRPVSLVVLTTVLDPSDRTGRVPGVLEGSGKLPLVALDILNRRIRALVATDARLALADAYLHFLGHGAAVPEEDRWYWRRSPLEPNARGAHELRRLWLETVASHAPGG